VLLGGLTLLLAGYVVARCAVLGKALVLSPVVGSVVNAALMLDGFGRSLVGFVFPFSGRVFVWEPAGGVRLAALAGVAVAYVGAAWFVLRARNAPAAKIAWLHGLFLLLPVAGLLRFGPVGRMLYLPGPGLVLLVGYAMNRAVGQRPAWARTAVVMALLAGAAFVPFARHRMQVWKDESALFSRMTSEAPGNPAGHFNLAFVLRSQGDVTGAIREYRTTIALDSNAVLAYSNLAALLQGRGELVEAATLYRRTIALRPGYSMAHNNLGVVLYLQGDPVGAITELRRALELAPNDAGAATNLARVYDRTGQLDSAERYRSLAARLQTAQPQPKTVLEQLRRP